MQFVVCKLTITWFLIYFYRIQDSTQRQEALWVVLKKLPTPNYDNLRYLVKFLRELSNHQDANKMSPANIAIVIAPNLLWSQPPPTSSSDDGSSLGDNSQMGLNMTMTHLYSSLLEQLISNCGYFFPDGMQIFFGINFLQFLIFQKFIFKQFIFRGFDFCVFSETGGKKIPESSDGP